MSFFAYPEYVSSGVEFNDAVPSHWSVQRLSELADFDSGKAHEPFIADDGQFIVVNSRFVSTQGESVKYCRKNLTPTKINDILMVMSDLPNGRALAKAFFVENNEPYAVNQRVCKISAKKIKARFLFYYMNRNALLLRNDDGLNQTHLSNSDFRKCPVFVPPEQEQEIIVIFLDQETSKIDSLIAEQETLVELLKEKRRAVISQAVTKGLDPSVKMKDSGVDWLGEVPEHWEIKKLKHLARLDGGAGFPHDEQQDQNGTINFFKVADLANGLTQSESKVSPYTASKLKAKIFSSGTIAFAKVGAALLLNRRVLMPQDGCVDNNMMVAIPKPSVNPQWLTHFLLTIDFATLVNPGAVPSINQEQVGNITIPMPHIKMQVEISSHVTNLLKSIDELVEISACSMKLLEERRSALISAAVTGQIDVRNFVQAEEAS